MSEQLRLYMLGGFRLERGGIALRLPAQKSKALLAYLALYPQAHPREKLASLFWGDSLDPDARKSLRVAFQHLYKALGKGLFTGDYETVQLAPDAPLWVDAIGLSRIANRQSPQADVASSDVLSAIGDYRGELLAGFYDDWVLEAREQLKTQYIELLLKLVAHARTQSEYAQAVKWAQQILQTDRANEPAYQHLIFLYAALGDRTAALKQFDECAAALEEELGVEPSAETIALAKKIKQQKTGTPSDVARLTNLPRPLTSFVGREREVAELRGLLTTRDKGQTAVQHSPQPSSLVTLIGAGGSGKTRLAIECGRALAEDFEHGVWWVELAPLSDAALVPNAVAKALGIAEQPHEPLLQTLVNELQERELLLILDNCEHLIDACAQLVQALISNSPISILATSREALDVAGEQVYPVAPLAVPRARQISLADMALEFSAVRLFVERARSVNSQFELTEHNAPFVIQICQRLDGIPLALELAAARVNQLSVRDLAAQLAQRFDVLIGARTALPRQQTLRALIDWSYDLLAPPERILFQRLSVFAGGWTLDAAQAICADAALPHAQILNVLLQLVSKSLVRAETAGDTTRYSFLETIREYAREKLAASGESEACRDQHLAYWLAVANDSATLDEFTTEGHARLDPEEDNLFASLQWALNNSASAPTRARQGVRLTVLLAALWEKGNNVQARYRWLQRALQVADELGDLVVETCAALLRYAGVFARFNDDMPTAIALLDRAIALAHFPHDATALLELSRVYTDQQSNDDATRAATDALALFRAHDHALGQARAYAQLGAAATYSGDWLTAQQHFHKANILARALNHPRLLLIALRGQAGLAISQGDLEQAERYAQEILAVNATYQDDWFQAAAIAQLGMIAAKRHQWELAREFTLQMLALWDRAGRRSFVVLRLLMLVKVEVATGHWERAATLWGAADGLIQVTGIGVVQAEQREFDESLEILRAQLDETTRVRAYMQGRAMSYAQIVQFALHPV